MSLLLAGPIAAQEECQERFQSGDYKGMLSCTAFQYVELQEPFTVRKARGVVTIPNSNDGIPSVIFELRGPTGKIIATITDSQGRFHFKHLSPGTYRFKTTEKGFSSVMGTIIVNKNTDRTRIVNIEMPVGV